MALTRTKLLTLLILSCLICVARFEEEVDGDIIDGFSKSERDFLEQSSEKFKFDADVSRLLDIIINSLYTQKEVFIRELISNSSDACDKVRFMAIQNPEIMGDKKECEIHIDYDDKQKTFSITDSGIGMTKQELIKNLGTIAKSGTTAFIEALSKGQQNMNLIGQFGVGFYSTYLVSNKVVVTSKGNDDDQHIWISRAGSTFEVSKDPRGNTLRRGTKITLHLKEDSHEYKEYGVIKKNIKRFSEFINFPIYLRVNTTYQREIEEEVEEEVEVSNNSTETNTTKTDEELEITESKKEKRLVMKRKNITDWKWDYERVNDVQPIWIRNKKEITKDEYLKFYKSLTKDNEDPFTYEHGSLEGEVNFKYIIYIPEKRPHDLYDNYYNKVSALKMYVKRVLVSESFEEIVPKYLNFVKGVIDSDDLPLNVSREQLQQHKMVKVMSKKLVRNIINIIVKMATKEDLEDEEEEKKAEEEGKEKKDDDVETSSKEKKKYLKFFENYGKNMKLGVIEDSPNRAKLTGLLRYYTSKNFNKLISLSKYIKRMKPKQQFIYFLAGDSKQSIFESPLLQKLREREIEVLLLDDPIDEFCIQNIPEFEGKKLKNVAKGELKLDDEDDDEKKKKETKIKEAYKPLIDWWKKLLDKKVEKIEISRRLTDTAAIVVSSEYGYSAHQEKISKAQAFTNQGAPKNDGYLYGKRTLEINSDHPSIKELLRRVREEDTISKETEDAASLTFETALLNSGYGLSDPNIFSNRIDTVLKLALNLDRDSKYEEFEVALEEEKKEEKKGEEVKLDGDNANAETKKDEEKKLDL